MEIRQNRNSNRIRYVFGEDEVQYSVEDTSGSRSFSVVPLLEEVRRLHSMLEDTVDLLGHDVMDFAYEGYQLLKLTGDAHGLEDQRKELGAQFSRRRRAQDAGRTPTAA